MHFILQLATGNSPTGHLPVPSRALIVMPTWLGDGVMATPTLRALRTLWPAPTTYLAAMLPAPLIEIFQPCPSIDELLPISKRGVRGMGSTLRAMRRGRFDLAVLLPNSFRWAAVAAAAGVPVRWGYGRDLRTPLLTHAAIPPAEGHWPRRWFTSVPTVEYYLRLAAAIAAHQEGAPHRANEVEAKLPDATLELWVSPDQTARATAVLDAAGIGADEPFVLLNVGAVRAQKRWPPERFAAVADRLYKMHGLRAAATGSPAERDLTAAVGAASRHGVADLAGAGIDLGALKAVCGRAAVVITNDTGTRHVAAAMGAPLVTLFGPTPPEWTTLDHPHEIELAVPDAGPIERLTVEQVTAAAVEVLTSASSRV